MITSNSFGEQVKNIVNGKGSKASKIDAIVKMGVPYNEARFVYTIYDETPARPRATRVAAAAYTFGVELEIANAPAALVRQSLEANSVVYNYEGYNHTDNTTYYKFVRDGSLSGASPIECVSPVLKSRGGFQSLEATCKALNEAGCEVNRSCGFHVHIGAKDLTDEAYVNVFINYMFLENVIDTFMAPSRRGNESYWCRTLKDHKNGLLNATTKGDVQSALRYDRYHRVNAESYGRHKTIEFRQHQGTTCFEKIEHWVKFCAKLVDWSKTHRLTADVASIDYIEFLTAAEKRWFKGRAAALAA